MKYIDSLNLKVKFTLLFILIGLVPAIIVSFISINSSSEDVATKVYNQLTAINQIKKQTIIKYFEERESDLSVLIDIADTMQQQAFQKLSAINSIKKSQLNDYFHMNKSQLDLLANSTDVHQAISELNRHFNNKRQWQPLLDKHDVAFKAMLDFFGWYDFFLINLEGDIIYSVTRESDLGQNLAKDLSDSSFYQAFLIAQKGARDEIHFADFKPYAPSNDDPAAFAVRAVTVNGKHSGYIAYQQPIEKMNEILGQRVGMGETGESYLVGQDNLMRSNSYLNPKDFSVEASFASNNKVNTTATQNALAGKTGTAVILDYNNNPVVSSWDYFEVGSNIRWAIISEIDVAEAFNPKSTSNEEFYKNYIEEYGYYDLFLITPTGSIFYTVARESDYQTNILDGRFSSSNLGSLIKQVRDQKRFGFADFAPYEPSNFDPAAFVAQPLLDSNGQVSLYVALQLPLEGIQAIMGTRDGMGETGESYLVGEDLKMRSNSFLDPTGHSVSASFAGTIEKNGVDTDAVRRALSGERNTDIIIDYNNNPVLSSFDRIEFDDFNWAILSEIDESEAFASIRSNTLSMTGLMIVVALVVAVAGFYVAKRVAQPISEISDVAQHVADGELTMNITQSSEDEVGLLQRAIQKMIRNLARMVESISNVAVKQAATSEQLAAITTQTSTTMAEQHLVSEQLATAMQEMGTTVKEVASNTTSTATAIEDIQHRVHDGTNKLNDTYNSILTMTEQIQNSEGNILQLRNDFSQVISILDVIKSIAEQTNLLALNAAIEAARAGEMGRGFAVVADEVRELAQRTQNSTQEIDDMINTIMSGADASVEVMAKSVEQANLVQSQAKEVTDLNKVITDEMQHINDLSTQIATAAEEQSIVVEQILENVESLNQGIMETSDATESIAKSSTELAELSTQLEKETSHFHTK